uniref:Uncharacterized protein n=1 Tax=Kalanchoe fedtschenkoi TaxID=63787 RepID=A0A7N0SYL9_KALFE
MIRYMSTQFCSIYMCISLCHYIYEPNQLISLPLLSIVVHGSAQVSSIFTTHNPSRFSGLT